MFQNELYENIHLALCQELYNHFRHGNPIRANCLQHDSVQTTQAIWLMIAHALLLIPLVTTVMLPTGQRGFESA